MRRWAKLLVLWFCMGAVYFSIEIVWRALTGGGRPHWSMWIVGGLCGLAVGAINQIPRFYSLKVWKQALLGTAMTLAVELAAGCVLNLWLGLGIWDYTGLPGNILGQICLPFAAAWYCLMPLAIWLEDTLRWGFWRERVYYTLCSIYLDWILIR